jgi:UDP-2,3-diacylglucosamine pyrophosphatase LpxH
MPGMWVAGYHRRILSGLIYMVNMALRVFSEDRGYLDVKKSYRAVFLSDIHLGSRACNAESLAIFLNSFETENLYLVGDIVDLWVSKNAWYWPISHNIVFQAIIAASERGTQVTYLLGNHDEMLHFLLNHQFGNTKIVTECTHTLLDGRVLWVIHGDLFDRVIQFYPILAHAGHIAYEWLVIFNNWMKALRIWSRWSLANFIQDRISNSDKFITLFEQAITIAAKKRGYDGVVCGHIHRPDQKNINGVLYLNDGDGVQNCCALVETLDGEVKHVYWG